MKETYELMEIEVQMLPEEDVITASAIATSSDHDNLFASFFSFE